MQDAVKILVHFDLQ